MKYTKKRKIYKKRSHRRRNKSRVTKRFRKRTYRLNGGGGENDYCNYETKDEGIKNISDDICEYNKKLTNITNFKKDNNCLENPCENNGKLLQLKQAIGCFDDETLQDCEDIFKDQINQAKEQIDNLKNINKIEIEEGLHDFPDLIDYFNESKINDEDNKRDILNKHLTLIRRLEKSSKNAMKINRYNDLFKNFFKNYNWE